MENKDLKEFWVINGYVALIIVLSSFLIPISLFFTKQSILMLILSIFIGIVGLLSLFGFFVLKPYQVAVANIFGGKFCGIFNKEGFYFTNPFYSLTDISTSMHNLQTQTLKITDKSGKPIDVSVIIKWSVENAYKALFSVKDYKEYLNKQTEAIARKTVKNYTYNEILTSDTMLNSIQETLNTEMSNFGIKIFECELGSLSYSTEIANAMLQKQQADSVIEARKSIVKGSVEIIKDLVEQLKNENIALSDEDKSKMVGNLMVVMMSKETAQPVINL